MMAMLESNAGAYGHINVVDRQANEEGMGIFILETGKGKSEGVQVKPGRRGGRVTLFFNRAPVEETAIVTHEITVLTCRSPSSVPGCTAGTAHLFLLHLPLISEPLTYPTYTCTRQTTPLDELNP
jgi:hypothetical protein